MTRDIPPFGLRMPAELKTRMTREAHANGRSLNAEILERLKRSLEQQDIVQRAGYTKAGEPGPEVARTDTEKAVLAIFRSLPPEKKLALLSLLK